MKPASLAPDYSHFLTEVKGRIQSARLQAGRAVNRELVLLYWDSLCENFWNSLSQN